MRTIAVALVVILVASVSGMAMAADRWTDMLEGAKYDSGWYFEDMSTDTSVETAVIDAATDNRAFVLTDNSTTKRARVQGGYWRPAAGVTIHTRFKVVSAESGAVAMQLQDGYNGSDATGRIQLSWSNGTLSVTRGTVDAGWPTSLAAPADTWVELWVTIKDGLFKIYTMDGGVGTLYTQGAASISGGVVYFGCSSTSLTGSMMVDFFRMHRLGAYAPDDPNRPTLPASTDRIGEAKANYVVGYPCSFKNKVVTNSWVLPAVSGSGFDNYLYIQDDDRSAGIKVDRPTNDMSDIIPVGSRIDMVGFMDLALGEAQATADSVQISTPAPTPLVLPVPLATRNGSVSTGGLGMQPPMSLTSSGLNDTGLRVRVFGRVTGVGGYDPTGYLFWYIDDGSGLANDSYQFVPSAVPGIKVYVPGMLTIGSYVAVSGNAQIDYDALGQKYYPAVRASSDSDISTFPE